MREFVQSQTIRNKKNLESTSAEAQRAHEKDMEAILRDGARRRDYLVTQAMLKSVERAKEIA